MEELLYDRYQNNVELTMESIKENDINLQAILDASMERIVAIQQALDLEIIYDLEINESFLYVRSLCMKSNRIDQDRQTVKDMLVNSFFERIEPPTMVDDVFKRDLDFERMMLLEKGELSTVQKIDEKDKFKPLREVLEAEYELLKELIKIEIGCGWDKIVTYNKFAVDEMDKIEFISSEVFEKEEAIKSQLELMKELREKK